MWSDMNLSKYLLNRLDERSSKLISTYKYTVSMRVCAQSCPCPSLCHPMDCNPTLLSPLDSPGKNTGEVCRFLLQEIFPAQGLKLLAFVGGFLSTEWPGMSHLYPSHLYPSPSLPSLSPFFFFFQIKSGRIMGNFIHFYILSIFKCLIVLENICLYRIGFILL